MIKVTCDTAREFLWIKTILDHGILNVSPDYYKKLMNQYGIKRTYTVNFEKSKEYINDLQLKEDGNMANVKNDKFQYLSEINHPLFTQNYTKVYATSEKAYNAHNSFVVANVETGEIISEVKFQEGPIKECGVNGVANEDLILMVLERLSGFQASEYACEENDEAISHLEAAVNILRKRTNKRKDRGVEGTSEI